MGKNEKNSKLMFLIILIIGMILLFINFNNKYQSYRNQQNRIDELFLESIQNIETSLNVRYGEVDMELREYYYINVLTNTEIAYNLVNLTSYNKNKYLQSAIESIRIFIKDRDLRYNPLEKDTFLLLYNSLMKVRLSPDDESNAKELIQNIKILNNTETNQ